jgi:hypothetical protein
MRLCAPLCSWSPVMYAHSSDSTAIPCVCVCKTVSIVELAKVWRAAFDTTAPTTSLAAGPQQAPVRTPARRRQQQQQQQQQQRKQEIEGVYVGGACTKKGTTPLVHVSTIAGSAIATRTPDHHSPHTHHPTSTTTTTHTAHREGQPVLPLRRLPAALRHPPAPAQRERRRVRRHRCMRR